MRIKLAVVAGVALFAVGCNDSKLNGATEGPRIEVTPATLVFDATAPGATNTKVATVKNAGGGILTVNNIQIGGATPASFAANAASAFPIDLGPGEWFAVQVTFAPGETGDHSGTMSILSNDVSTPSADVELVTAGLAGHLDASPNPLNMTATVNATVTGTVTVSNTGAADLVVSGAALGNGTSSFFTLAAETFPKTLTPGQAFTLTVTFHPTSSTAASGSIDIASDDPAAATTSVALNGNGAVAQAPDINATPNPVAFGDVQRLTCATKTTAVQNLGNATLNVTGITRLFLTNDITWTPSSFTVAPGGSQTLTVKFCPTYTGGVFGQLSVASNDPDENPYGITITGNGTPPPLSATDISVKLTWDSDSTDVDTHMWRASGSFNSSSGDCYYANCVGVTPDWGVAGDHSDDPYLDTDDVDGYGPENLNISNAPTDTYTIAIYYYSDHGHEGQPTNATVHIYLNGTEVYTGAKSILNHKTWTVGKVAWNHATDSGTWTLVDTVAATAHPPIPPHLKELAIHDPLDAIYVP